VNTAADRPLVSFDPKPWLRAARFVGRALRRRWLVAASLTVVFTAAGAGASTVLPREYSGETRLLTKKNFTMPALAAPRRAVPPSSEAPAQSAAELVLQRDALERVVREAKLVERWKESAPAPMRAKQALREWVKGPASDEDLEDALVWMLRKRLRVTVEEHELIRIRVTWWDADAVLAILDEALAAFLESRERLDVESIARTEAILARNAEALRSSMERRLADFRDARAAAAGSTTLLLASRAVPQELETLRTDLLARQRYRQELERQRDLRIGHVQLQIAEQSATLGERHPDQIAARDALTRLMEDDGGVAQAAVQERELERAYLARGGSRGDFSGSVRGPSAIDGATSPDEDASVIYARALLRIDVDDYQDMVSRLNNARIELETARAAFEFRYMVTGPAERPRRPDGPNVMMIVIGGLIAGLASGVSAALALELRSRLAALLREQLTP
jgi:uncharacterized protein involved in exopolysaccharide biosynthesis